MVELNTLVVFYPGMQGSMGATRCVASRIARSLRADSEELVFRMGRGFFENLRWSIGDALGWATGIDSVRRDPSRYDLVIVGTPIGSTPEFAPVRSYLFLFNG